jgi:hypothetical protein
MPLERRTGVPEAKGHPLVLEEAKGGGDSGLLHVRWVDRNLVVAHPQVSVGKNCVTRHLRCKIKHLGQQVVIRCSHQVEAKIAARTPTAVGLPHHVKRVQNGCFFICKTEKVILFLYFKKGIGL